MRRPAPATVRWLILAALLVFWELFPRTGIIPELFMPALSKVVMVLIKDWREYASELMVTLYEVGAAMLIACGFGILAGALIGGITLLRNLLLPVFSSMYAVPIVILYPIFTAWFGIGSQSKIIFAGVGKTDEEIRFALENRILMFDVESEAELDAISRIAAELGVVGPIALRLNPDIDAKTHAKTTTGKKGNKFGMDIERHNQLAAKVLADPNLSLWGIHLHIGSPINTVEPYAQAAAKAVDVVRELREKGHKTNWINLGGGFGLNYRGSEAATPAQYAEVIVPKIKEADCRLALEPGRSICGNAGVLISTVIFTKREGGSCSSFRTGP